MKVKKVMQKFIELVFQLPAAEVPTPPPNSIYMYLIHNSSNYPKRMSGRVDPTVIFEL